MKSDIVATIHSLSFQSGSISLTVIVDFEVPYCWHWPTKISKNMFGFVCMYMCKILDSSVFLPQVWTIHFCGEKKGEYSKLAGNFYNLLFTCQSLHMYKILNQQVCGRHVLVISDTSGWLTSSFRDDAMLSHDKCSPQILALRCLMEENRHIWNAMSFCRQADSIT